MSPPFLRRRGNPTCFFCLSAVSPAPPDPRSYRCPHCGCWNRYDANGEIISDEPAMHDDKLNTRSFAKRASPNKDRLPSTYSKAPFCHTCQTNQMLLVNLLSNYLPPSQHPDYAQRAQQLPVYRESLHMRYPPICADCLPAVQDEIEQKNQMARTTALGGWLKESRGKDRRYSSSGSGKDCESQAFQLAVWRVKGALWWTTLVCVLVAYAAAVRGYNFPHWLAGTVPVLPPLCFCSLLYATWDPTYHRFQKARERGRQVSVKGKTPYVTLQVLSWFSRFATSIFLFLPWHSPSRDYLHLAAYPLSYRVGIYCSISLVIELSVFSSSFIILRLQRPPAIRLIDTSTRSSSVRDTPELLAHSARASPIPTAPVVGEPDLLAALTLSSKPLISSTNPMFGQPSLVSSTPAPPASQASPIRVDEGPDEDAMDWTPTNPALVEQATNDNDGSWLRPQRFFPPEHPTGLESLFANTRLDDGSAHSAKQTAKQSGLWSRTIRWWKPTIAVVLLSLGTVVYHKWTEGRAQ